MTALSSVLFVAFLLSVNALYVVAELGVLAAPRARVRQLAAEGNWIARRLVPSLEDPAALDRWVAACQIGITISSLVLGAFGDARIAPALEPVLLGLGASARAAQSTATALVLLGLTVLQMVAGELVPKAIALQFPTRAVLATALPLGWSIRAFSGLIRVLNGASRLVARAIGVEGGDRRHAHSPDEIAELIAESSSGGLLAPDVKERLHEALRLGMRDARQLMVPRPRIVAIELDAEEPEILEALGGAYTRLPVYRSRFDEIVGVLHTKDVVTQRLRTGRVPPIAELMRPVLVLGDLDRADVILARMREHGSELAIVKDPSGLVVGLVTLEDVLASVFGDIRDELEPRRLERRGMSRPARPEGPPSSGPPRARR